MNYIPELKNKSIYKTYLIYFISMVLFCFVRILASDGWMSLSNTTASDFFYTILIQIIIMFLLPLILYCRNMHVTPRAVFKTCNFDKFNWSVVFISLGLGILCFVINIIVSTFFSGLITFTGYETPIIMQTGGEVTKGFWPFAIDVLLVAIIPAFCEEFMHRGIVLQSTKHMGFNKSIVISSILFGLLHFNINQVSYAIVLGLIMGFVSVVAKNIWPAIIIHFTNNFISVYLDHAANNNWFMHDFYDKVNHALNNMSSITIFIVVAITLIVVVLLLFWLVVLLYKQTILRKVNKAINKVYTSDNYDVQNAPITTDKTTVIKDMLATNTMLNLDYEEMKSPIQVVMPKQKEIYRTGYRDNIFLVGSMCLGFLITLFTYIWGFI